MPLKDAATGGAENNPGEVTGTSRRIGAIQLSAQIAIAITAVRTLPTRRVQAHDSRAAAPKPASTASQSAASMRNRAGTRRPSNPGMWATSHAYGPGPRCRPPAIITGPSARRAAANHALTKNPAPDHRPEGPLTNARAFGEIATSRTATAAASHNSRAAFWIMDVLPKTDRIRRPVTKSPARPAVQTAS